MWQFILRRTVYSLLILLGVLILTFVLFRMAAGDPVATLLGKNPKPEEVEQLRRSLGSDRPMFYGKWRKTEAYTNVSFSGGRSEFNAVTYEGQAIPDKTGMILKDGGTIIFRQNFPPDSEKCLVRIEAEGSYTVNGNNCTGDSATEITAGNQSVYIKGDATIKKVSFSRASDAPFDSQLLASLKEIVTFKSSAPYVEFFNFGRTLTTREPIREKLWNGMFPSLMLMLPIFFGELLLGIILAMIACVWRGTWVDRVIVVLSVAGMSISYLALIIAGQWLLGYYWNWFPVWGWGGAKYLVLPVIIGIISGTGSGVRFYRTVFLNEINREYLRTAVAKGASPLAVYGKHLLRNSMIPIITRASGILPFLFTGSLLLESFFGIPGLGSAGISALHDADLQMLKALVILSSFLFVVINLLTDIAYAYVDPRMRPAK